MAAVLLLGACGPVQPPPAAAGLGGEDRTFQVVSHGWHAGIVVDRTAMAAVAPELVRAFPAGDRLEIGWGDARYYQADEPSAWVALRALFWPTASVLHVVGFSGPPEAFFPESEVFHVCVGEAGYGRLLASLAETFQRSPGGAPVGLGPGLYGRSRFFGAEGAFHAFNTCNTWAARVLADAGLPVSRTTLTAESLMAQLRSNLQDAPPCGRAPETPSTLRSR